MNEHDFIKVLQDRAKEQHQALNNLPFPKVFALVTTWLSDHPWRYLIPLAFFLTLLARNIFGPIFTDLVLKFFYKL